MSEAPCNNDIQLIFKKLRAISTNKSCFDCQAKLPTWSSVTYGVFICIDCSAVHRSLGVHLTFVRSTQLDTNWTWLQLRQMQLGGNANADSFFRQHNCVTTDAQQKYNSRAAQLYRDKLHSAAIQAMRLHGTKLEIGPVPALGRTLLHLEPAHEPQPTPEERGQVDFFEEHSSTEFKTPSAIDNQGWLDNGNRRAAPEASQGAVVGGTGPDVSAALGGTVEPSGDRKSIIGGRKPAAKKMALGGKKGGMGAQRVKANFADIEREAELADQLRVQQTTPAPVPEKTQEEQDAQMASMRLAYQDLSIQQKREEEKLKNVDPKKAKQVERLGMGFSSRTGVSHSAFSDMKTIEQETPVKNSRSRDDDDDFFHAFSGSSAGFSMYKGNRTPTEPKFDIMFFDTKSHDHSTGLGETTNRNADKRTGGSGWSETTGGGGWGDAKNWRDSNNDSDWPSTTEKKSTSTSGRKKEWGEPEQRQPSRGGGGGAPAENKTAATSDEAQKKFGSAKAISSAQFFGDSNDSTWERKANMTRFENSSSISSADYFNREETLGGGGGYSVQSPDLEDVRESVRQGVTKVAGKLSSLANGVMSSIQEKYGGY